MSKLIITVEPVSEINSIPNADRIVLATVKGWNTIIAKDSFCLRQLGIFIPPDAVLPQSLIEEQKLDFLKSDGRVKTLKLKGVISQGLLLPLSALKGYHPRVGEDVGDRLGIKKYEPEVKSVSKSKDTYISLWNRYVAKEITLRRFVAKIVWIIYDSYFKPKKRGNPNFKEYTDIQNQKHYPVLFQEGEEVIISEKIHGTNFRAACLPRNPSLIDKWFHLTPTYEFVYGSHTVQKMPLSGPGYYGEDVYGKVAAMYKLKDLIPPGYTIYGEIFGENKPGAAIQKGFSYGIEKIDVRFFDVKKDDKYLSWDEFVKFCNERELPIVPILYRGPFTAEILKSKTHGNTTVTSICFKDYDSPELVIIDQIREGCVVKPIVETYDNRVGRKVLKSVSADYLLLQHKTKADETTEYQH